MRKLFLSLAIAFCWFNVAYAGTVINPFTGKLDVSGTASGGGGSSTWTANGNDQYSSVSGNVGVGTATPQYKLHILGTVKATQFLTDPSNTPQTDYFPTQTSDTHFTLGINADGGNDNDDNLVISEGTVLGSSNRWTMNPGGNVGIGTDTAGTKLYVNGGTKTDTLQVSATGAALLVPSGNVGVGSAAPGQKLDVQGTIRALQLAMTTGAASGSILMSNSVGIGTWIAASAVGGAGGGSGTVNTGVANAVAVYSGAGTTVDDAASFYVVSANVGVGTALPQSIFEARDNVTTGVIRGELASTTGTTIWSVAGPTATKTPGLSIRSGTTDVAALIACRGSGSQPYSGCQAQDNAGVGSSGAKDFNLYSNNISRMTVTSAGNIGIGTVGPVGNAFVVNACAAHAGQGSCWTTLGAAGFCTTVVSAGGACTCTAC